MFDLPALLVLRKLNEVVNFSSVDLRKASRWTNEKVESKLAFNSDWFKLTLIIK